MGQFSENTTRRKIWKNVQDKYDLASLAKCEKLNTDCPRLAVVGLNTSLLTFHCFRLLKRVPLTRNKTIKGFGSQMSDARIRYIGCTNKYLIPSF